MDDVERRALEQLAVARGLPPGTPRRKPIYPEETLDLRAAMKTDYLANVLSQRPVSNLGAAGPTYGLPFDILKGGYRLGGVEFRGGNPNTGPIGELLDRNALPQEGQIVAIGKSYLPKEDDKPSAGVMLHEFGHRGVEKLKAGGFSLPKINVRMDGWSKELNEEAFATLFDASVGGDVGNGVELRLDKSIGKSRPSTKEILADPKVLEALMMIQSAAADELAKQGVSTPIHFESGAAPWRGVE